MSFALISRWFLLACLAVASGPRGRALQPADLDRTVRPCDDFFQFANGGWLQRTAIPADQGGWGAFNELRERNRGVLRSILEECAQADAPAGSLQQKVGDFYASGMDVQAIERAGLRPLGPALRRIEAIHSGRDLAAALASAHLEGGGPGFGFGVGPDDRQSAVSIAQFSQGGLGLPDRDDYLAQDERARTLRAQYLAHLGRMFGLAGDRGLLAKARAGIVLALETRLAQASMTRVERRDPQAVYHRMTLGELARLAPGFDWAAYCQAVGLAGESVLVRQPGFFQAFAAAAREVPLPQWRAYLRWHALRDAAPCLGAAFQREQFAFYGTTLNGIKEPPARWKRVQDATDGALGEALGRLYVERAFSRGARDRALALVANLRAALAERLQGLDWMSPGTRAAALEKLAALSVKVGYPDHWRDYGGLEITRTGFAENVARANVFEFKRRLASLGRPVDRTEWFMTTPTVNAYYNPLMNEIVFPAGILQPPFFDPMGDDAGNYGAIGVVIGHELTHGFDDHGRQYDAQGNLRDWWTPEDSQAFAARTGPMVRQFDALEALPGLRLNGSLTLGENLADLGGLRLAFAAFRKAREGRPVPAWIDGFPAEQRFFLAFAQAWHFQARDEAIRLRVQVDPHAPPRFRVNAPLANLPEFAEAFGCGAGTAMVRPAGERPAIW